jgi:hypothetical protein|tara:strand:- start:1316 stop:1555 length:240 start_codon:yes stop_codon:yes gene_type:complete
MIPFEGRYPMKWKTGFPRQIVIRLPEGQDEVTFPCYDRSEPAGTQIRVESVRVGESKVITDVSGDTYKYTVVRKRGAKV